MNNKMAMANLEKKEVGTVNEGSKIKYRIRPTRYLNYDCARSTWDVEFHLPGVKKEDIDIKFLKGAYHLEAVRGQALYHASEYLPFDINPDSIKADYNNGLLHVKGTIHNPLDDAVEIKLD